MTQEEMMAKLLHNTSRMHELFISKLLPAARAAANAMKDAGMTASADPLSSAIFEIDVIEHETETMIRSNPGTAVPALLELIRRGRR